MHNRWSIKRLSLWTLLLMQVILAVLYFTNQNESSTNGIQHNLKNSITFIATVKNVSKNKIQYYNERNKIILTSKHVEELFEDFNTSLCYKSGTDLKLMRRHKDINWKCLCFPGWHGNDCGQPEVIWRALLASKKPQFISGPRRIQRRLIYFTEIDSNSADFVEITLHELKHVTDLFILFDYSLSSSIKSRLDSGFLKDLFKQVLYITGANQNEAWRKTKRIIRNLREDDIFFIGKPFELPNVRALYFLKLYNGWPQSITFRLKWSVYGFFWKHPDQTTLTTAAVSINYLYNALEDNLDKINNNLISTSNLKNKQGFIVGDLNHFGGWFCEFCMEPNLILRNLKTKFANNTSILDKVSTKRIDLAYIEELIENGVYIDGITELKRVHRSNENYYAPDIVSNNTWKYDWLLINLYSKLDYY